MSALDKLHRPRASSAPDSEPQFLGPVSDSNEGSDVNPNDIDLEAAGAEVIGFASSGGQGKPRWTDLTVYWLRRPPSPGRPWLSESRGRSSVPGETDRVQRLNVGSLERALKLFADTDLGVVASEQARDWEETRTSYTEVGSRWDEETGLPQVPDTDAEAIAWLYSGELDDTPRATFASMLARDFDLAPRTVTTALKEGTPIRVPLRLALRFFDRAAFWDWRASREKGDG